MKIKLDIVIKKWKPRVAASRLCGGRWVGRERRKKKKKKKKNKKRVLQSRRVAGAWQTCRYSSYRGRELRFRTEWGNVQKRQS